MVIFMDKNGRIVRLDCSLFPVGEGEGPGRIPPGGGKSTLTGDEIVLDLLSKLPREEFLRGPYQQSILVTRS